MIPEPDAHVQADSSPPVTTLYVLEPTRIWLGAIPMATRHIRHTANADIRILCSSALLDPIDGFSGMVTGPDIKLLVESDRNDLEAVRTFCELLVWSEPKVREIGLDDAAGLFRVPRKRLGLHAKGSACPTRCVELI